MFKRRNKSRSDIGERLRTEGYLNADATDVALEGAIATFQRDHGLEPSGRLDDPTMRMLEMPVCGNVALLAAEAAAAPVPWADRNLRFVFLNNCPTLNPADTILATQAAFGQWSTAVPSLHFTPGPTAHIKIGWFNGDHGDGFGFLAFDGKGGEFGHGFGPGSPVRPGEVHMDAAETWTVNGFQPGNADLMTVVLHEIGHALGLDHLPQPTAVMFRRFPVNSVKRILTPPDVAAIRALYP